MAHKLRTSDWIKENGKRGFNVKEFVASQGAPIVVLKFGAVWCSPCRNIAPLYKKLAEKYKDCMVCFDIDIEESSDIVNLLSISTLPTFLFLSTQLSNNAECQKVQDLVGADSGALTQRFESVYEMMKSRRDRGPPPQQQQQAVNVDGLLNEVMELEHLILGIQQRLDSLRNHIQTLRK
jgi:thiol-disulfide isomerase/thioredoxin